MTATTVEHANWTPHVLRQDAPGVAADSDVKEVSEEHVQRIIKPAARSKRDPHARERLAHLLYRATGWETFAEDSAERAYVSRLWAEDWDSPEDTAYDREG